MEPYSDNFLTEKLYSELETLVTPTKKISIEKPEVSNANKRTFIANFKNICNKLNRKEDEVRLFFEEELKTTVTINQDGALIITGNYKQNGIMTVLTNYMKEYVICKQCNSCDTGLIKESKITFLICSKCLSKYALSK